MCWALTSVRLALVLSKGALECRPPAIRPTCTCLDVGEGLEGVAAQLQEVGRLDHVHGLADQPLRLLQPSVVGRSHGRHIAPLALGGDVVRGARLLGQCDGGLHLVASAKEIESLGLHRRQRRQDARFANLAEDGNARGKLAFGGLEILGEEFDPSPGEGETPSPHDQSTLLEVVPRFPEVAASLVEAPLHREERGQDREACVAARISIGRRQSQAALHCLRDRHGSVSQRIPDLKDRERPQPRILAGFHEIQRMLQLRQVVHPAAPAEVDGCPSMRGRDLTPLVATPLGQLIQLIRQHQDLILVDRWIGEHGYLEAGDLGAEVELLVTGTRRRGSAHRQTRATPAPCRPSPCARWQRV